MMDNLAVVLHAQDDLRMENVALPVAGPGEVLLQMQSVGICGSDVHYWTHGRIGDFVVRAPMVLGHEASGIVCGIGEGTNTSLQVGDRVAIEPGVPCRACEFCKVGRYNLCPGMQFCATPPVHGSLCRFYKHAADFCFKIPDEVSFDEAALLEPLSVAVHACRRGGVSMGSKVLICGAGPIGLVNLLVAKAAGASAVVMIDLNEARLATAMAMGCDHVLNASAYATPTLVADAVRASLGGEMPNVTIECSGAESSLKNAIYSTKSGGCVVCVGMGRPENSLPLLEAACREVDIRGIFRYVNCYPTALELIASKKVDVKPLITHRVPLADAVRAFEITKNMTDNAIKVIIDCGGSSS
ncbi:Sorbitol dehydrogenase [Porphyridium purpureum]|uniref:Sorbitol dehydrogenase n=1 Tax=Porphyridium purpureum TaxID=35688 RepID=A0A5J4Z4L1_PORPP|nr:Sorbitol dehydrogenase [Porphyridium purpureum]|eukprot:POR6558..scf295_1